ncbi:MAG: lycopene cyclase [Chitinophagaceae bacterium]|nr:lycopene cyclase [Chitinophagaceae bacterium]
MLKYDFIILGSGAAGLSLLMRMIASSHFNNKKILLIDRDIKNKNDRTWCFWENKDGFFDHIVYKKWSQLSFYGESPNAALDIHPYQYKMIRGIDFYNYCFERIKQCPNIDIKYGELKSVVHETEKITICLEEEELHCTPAIIFNSIYKPSDPSKKKIQLLQHFKGWLIETDSPYFVEEQATLMDFRVHQRYGTSFVYVLPVSDKRALVEYTLFTPQTLEPRQYDTELKDYIGRFLKLDKFTIAEQEFGIIPMTNERFHFYQSGMYYIGIAGGQTKASTGYTFQFIQKQSQHIVDSLVQNQSLSLIPTSSRRFHFYDSVLLQLLATKKLGGKEIFSRLFQRNKASRIFKFLDNETSLKEELSLISTLQTFPFLKASLQVLKP